MPSNFVTNYAKSGGVVYRITRTRMLAIELEPPIMVTVVKQIMAIPNTAEELANLVEQQASQEASVTATAALITDLRAAIAAP